MPRLKATETRRRRAIGQTLLVAVVGMFAPASAPAHFVLVTPDSWMSQTSFGMPQKLGPCGNEGGGTTTGDVTVFHPGQTIPVTIDEVIHHPGHYRVALSVNDRSELPAPPVVTPSGGDACASAAIQSPPVFPVLADNMLPHTGTFSGPQTFMVTLPTDVTCDNCTLQVLEFMSSHGAPCFYYHCADISIRDEVVTCGDGEVQSTEQCDDGNTASGDDCDSDCRLECESDAQSTLGIGMLLTPAGDDRIVLRGSLTLPSPVSPALDPIVNGIRLLVDGSGGTVLDAKIPGGAGWTVNSAATKWAYRNTNGAVPGGIFKVVIQDASAVTPGLLRFSVRGKAASAAVTSDDLPLTARMVIAPSGGQCGDSTFSNCTFNGSGNSLRCE